ncbi:hypothetical protein LTR37_014944 [Vermiconidia calcicola]|uniref:Uncharacterized protein n=1 Tax=Vermiconidia calcicola TaxID=1690605 RepID=A0ACC3MTM4_9PEZI|nr:hypothetical protein LTR37_014944 [Vermiconidia calcicola]
MKPSAGSTTLAPPKNGMFTGYYNSGQTKSMCPWDSYGRGDFFQVQNLNNNAGFELVDGDCVQRIQNEILGCRAGGESVVSGWRFRAQVNGC